MVDAQVWEAKACISSKCMLDDGTSYEGSSPSSSTTTSKEGERLSPKRT